jgi:hypothetical protein
MMLTVIFSTRGQDHRLVVMAAQKLPSEFFMELSLQSGINIIYSDNVIERLPPVTLEMKGVSVNEIMDKVLQGTQIAYRYEDQHIILYQMAPPLVRYTISGMVTDSISGEPLISAYVFEENSGKGTLTNNYGYYNLNIPTGPIKILAGYLGYKPKIIYMDLGQNEMIHLHLNQSGLLKPVIVNASRQAGQDDAVVMPAERITLADLQSNIHLGGSSDLYRAADFIPGVHTGTDGVGGIHVRAFGSWSASAVRYSARSGISSPSGNGTTCVT